MQKILTFLYLLLVIIKANAQVPTITSFYPISAKPGDTVIITGTNFNINTINDVVYFGATRAMVITATVTSLNVRVPLGAAYAPITFLNTGTSLGCASRSSFNPIYSPPKSGISPADFDLNVEFPILSNSSSITLGDLDGDGKPDLVVAPFNNSWIQVFRNISTSGIIASNSFAAGVGVYVGGAVRFVSINDVDGDGKSDIVVAAGSLFILRNTSNPGIINSSSFAAAVSFVAGGMPCSISIGDIDGDGKPDLTAANYNSNTISVLRNTTTVGIISSSSFAPKVDFAAGLNPNSIAIRDLDGDNKPDIGVTNEGSNSVSIFRNTATNGSITTGSLAPKVDYTTGSTPGCLNVGDLNGDGKAELTVTNTGSNSVSVYGNTSVTGIINLSSFAAKVDYASGPLPIGIVISDLDGNGKPDLAIANNSSTTISVLRNTYITGNFNVNSFASKIDCNTGSNPSSIASADIDGDGRADLVTSNFSFNTISVLRNSDLPPSIKNFIPTSASPGDTVRISGSNFNVVTANNKVFFGATAATIINASDTSINAIVPQGALHAPITLLNNLSKKTCASYLNFNPIYNTPKNSINNSDFLPKIDFTAGTGPYSVSFGDLDGDNKPDWVVANYNSNTISIFRNTSTSGSIGINSFANKVDFITGTGPNSLTVKDLNGDGKLDLAVANRGSNTVSIFRNKSINGIIDTGSFAAKVDYSTGSAPYSIASGDLDGDGKPDLAVTNYLSNTISVFKNTSTVGAINTNSFAPKVDFNTGNIPFVIAVNDLDGDGKPDIIVANRGSNTVSIFRNKSIRGIIDTGSFTPKIDFLTGTAPNSIAIGDLNVDGKPDLAIANYSSNTVSVFRNKSISGIIDTGSFSLKVDFATGTIARSAAIGDLDGDGKPDLAIANYSSNTISVFRNKSTNSIIDTGSFSPKVDFATGSLPTSLAIGDLDGDGKPDLATNGSTNISILRNSNRPIITAFSPTSSGCAPNTTVSITGFNFNGVTAVNIGSTPVSSFTINSATQITAILSNGTTGKVTLTNSQGTGNSDGVFTVNSLPNITTTPSGNTTFCLGGSVVINANTGTGLSYQWRNSSGNIIGANLSSYIATLAGIYKVVISNTSGCVDSSAAVNVTVTNTNTWSGTTGTAWGTTTNWGCGRIPVITDNVVIVPTANQPVITDGGRVANDLTINTGAALTINNAASVLSIGGVYNNNGTLTHTAGELVFAGAANQNIPAGTYSKINVNNAAGVTLTGNVVMSDSLKLNNGNVTLGANNLTLSGSTSVVSNASASRYIITNANGSLIIQNIGSTGRTGTVTFPVGNSTYNPLTLTNAGTADNFTVRVLDNVTNTPPTGLSLTSNAVARTWAVNEAVTGGSNATVSVQWTATNELAGFNRAGSYLAFYNGSTWMASMATAAAGTNPYTQTRTGITSFSYFGVGSTGTLPVELLTFTAERKGREVSLDWATASEHN
ncbi:MAG: beta strand repeat-containing protein, partial [Bacteroidota bacterium]